MIPWVDLVFTLFSKRTRRRGLKNRRICLVKVKQLSEMIAKLKRTLRTTSQNNPGQNTSPHTMDTTITTETTRSVCVWGGGGA